MQVSSVQTPGLGGKHADDHLDARVPQRLEAGASHALIWILVSGNHLRDPRLDHRSRARGRTTVMGARLEIHVEGCASGLAACLLYR
jgi:hypothetical protein